MQPPLLNSLSIVSVGSQPTGTCSLPAAGGTDGTRVQHLSEVKSHEVERPGLSREQETLPCCSLVLSLLPAAEEALINARKVTNTST